MTETQIKIISDIADYQINSFIETSMSNEIEEDIEMFGVKANKADIYAAIAESIKHFDQLKDKPESKILVMPPIENSLLKHRLFNYHLPIPDEDRPHHAGLWRIIFNNERFYKNINAN